MNSTRTALSMVHRESEIPLEIPRLGRRDLGDQEDDRTADRTLAKCNTVPTRDGGNRNQLTFK